MRSGVQEIRFLWGQTTEAPLENRHVEVHRIAAELEIRQNLRQVDWLQMIDCFQLDDDVLGDHVDPIAAIQDRALVLDRQRNLSSERYFPESKLSAQALFVG